VRNYENSVVIVRKCGVVLAVIWKLKLNYGDYVAVTRYYEHYVADVRIYAELRVATS
jgi:hypothetical protein